ncbi:hypothetical protein C8R44DRAFT_985940, partial [Mycena epipterygia]
MLPCYKKNEGLIVLPVVPNAINSAKNLVVGSVALRRVIDQQHGILQSPNPKIWLTPVNIMHTVTSFTFGVSHPDLLTAAPPCVVSNLDIHRFIIKTLADAATLYTLFAAPELQSETQSTISYLRQVLQQLKKSKKSHPGMERLDHLLTTGVEYDDSGELEDSSKHLLQQLFNVLEPGSDEVERLESVQQDFV